MADEAPIYLTFSEEGKPRWHIWPVARELPEIAGTAHPGPHARGRSYPLANVELDAVVMLMLAGGDLPWFYNRNAST